MSLTTLKEFQQRSSVTSRPTYELYKNNEYYVYHNNIVKLIHNILYLA